MSVKQLRPHPIQSGYYRSDVRFNVACAGRRSGKTDVAQRRLSRRALGHDRPEPGRYFACAPTLAQAKEIFLDEERGLPAYFEPWMYRKPPRLTPLPKFFLINGSDILVFGLAEPRRVEGLAFHGGLIDEVDDAPKHAWYTTLRPMLSDPRLGPGWCDFIGRPRRRQLIYSLSRLGLNPAEDEWAFWTWPSSDIIDPREIESAKRTMSWSQYEQEYNASFITIEGRAYDMYAEDTHARWPLRDLYDPAQPLYIFLDFNKSPGVAALGQYMRVPLGQEWANVESPFMGIIGEVWIEHHSTTPHVCRRIIHDWSSHSGPVTIYGDASGGRSGERTSSTQGTDWALVDDYLRPCFGDRLEIIHKHANPPELVRVNAVNARFRTADGKIHLLVDRAFAPHVHEDFMGVQLVPGGSGEILKIQGDPLTHLSDGIGYWAEIAHPIGGRAGSIEMVY
jgi:hypothetical protein